MLTAARAARATTPPPAQALEQGQREGISASSQGHSRLAATRLAQPKKKQAAVAAAAAAEAATAVAAAAEAATAASSQAPPPPPCGGGGDARSGGGIGVIRRRVLGLAGIGKLEKAEILNSRISQEDDPVGPGRCCQPRRIMLHNSRNEG
jgi:hypothetical protein